VGVVEDEGDMGMIVGKINKEYLEAEKRARKLFINYVVRYIDKWCPKGTAGMKSEWKRNGKAYYLSIKIEKLGGSNDIQ